jgi:dCTP deaminase
MSALSNIDIQWAYWSGILDIEPFDASYLQPASYDLGIEGDVVLIPGEFKLLRTKERVSLSDQVQGQLHGKSSTGREGVLIHITAGFVDPGFSGTLTLECVNLSNKPVSYKDGTRICQIAFQYLRTAADPVYSGRYQGQTDATPSRR